MIAYASINNEAMMRIIKATYLTVFTMMHSIWLPSLTYLTFSHSKLWRIAHLKSFSFRIQIILFTQKAH